MQKIVKIDKRAGQKMSFTLPIYLTNIRINIAEEHLEYESNIVEKSGSKNITYEGKLNDTLSSQSRTQIAQSGKES